GHASALLRQADLSRAGTSPDKLHQGHGNEAEHATDDDIGHALFCNSACSSRKGRRECDEEATRAEAHGVAGERYQRQGCTEDCEGIADPALRQCYSDQEADWYAYERSDGSQLQLAGHRGEVANHDACG